MFSEIRGIIRKADIVLLCLIILFSGATGVWAYRTGDPGAAIRVEVDGELYGTYPLDTNVIVDIDSAHGHNQLTIRDGKAYISEASCPDQYCMDQHKSSGGIDRSDQSLICLPNRVVVTVEGGAADGPAAVDAVAGAPDGGKEL